MTVRDAVQYGDLTTEASKSILLELWTMLGAYREHMVLVGGWVPWFLIERHGDPEKASHVGSIDIDVALDHRNINDDHYATIRQILDRRGYVPRLDTDRRPIPFIFLRDMVVSGTVYQIEVDFLAAESGGTGARHRTQTIQPGLLARKARGCDVVFDHCEELSLEGRLPDGSSNRCRVKMADITGCLTTKGIALGDRYKEKDAYDAYMVVKHCFGGSAGVAAQVRGHLADGLVREGLVSLAEKFYSVESSGSVWAARFLTDDEDLLNRYALDAHMQVWEFLRLLDQSLPSSERLTATR